MHLHLSTTSLLAAGAIAMLITSCHGGSNASSTEGSNASSAQSSAATVEVSAAARQEANTIFSTRCATCHGIDGRGDGMAATALNPKPRNYHDKAWQAKVTDAHIAKTIVQGGAAVGLSPLMAPNPDLKDKPEVVQALVQKVRSFGQD